MTGRLRIMGNQSSLFSVGASLTLSVLLTACISGEVNLLDERRMTIETEGPEEVEISVSAVVEEQDSVEIRGVVWWARNSPSMLKYGHIDIEIIDSEGTSWIDSGVPIHTIFVHRGVRQRARFTAHPPAEVDEGATILVRFHKSTRHQLDRETGAREKSDAEGNSR